MSSSFVVNLADLTKILEQIKVAERHAAGESLVDIIGQDAALLPIGLRTVDGSYNHLLPGDTGAGSADQVFQSMWRSRIPESPQDRVIRFGSIFGVVQSFGA